MGKFASLVVCFLPVVCAHRMVVDVHSHIKSAETPWEEFSASSLTNTPGAELVGFGACRNADGNQYSFAQYHTWGTWDHPAPGDDIHSDPGFVARLDLCASAAAAAAAASPSAVVGFVFTAGAGASWEHPDCTLYFGVTYAVWQSTNLARAAIDAAKGVLGSPVSSVWAAPQHGAVGPVEGSGGDVVGSYYTGGAEVPEAQALCYKVPLSPAPAESSMAQRGDMTGDFGSRRHIYGR